MSVWPVMKIEEHFDFIITQHNRWEAHFTMDGFAIFR